MRAIFTTLLFLSFSNLGMTQSIASQSNKQEVLSTYLIEREIPGAGELTQLQLQGISKNSCAVIKEIGPKIEWLHSYVTDDKVYCIYKAANEDIIREHAEKGGFPVNKISLLVTTIGPATAE